SRRWKTAPTTISPPRPPTRRVIPVKRWSCRASP
ncbi:hypothetical protein AZ034_003520, partial [Pluralibacter gergoviae]